MRKHTVVRPSPALTHSELSCCSLKRGEEFLEVQWLIASLSCPRDFLFLLNDSALMSCVQIRSLAQKAAPSLEKCGSAFLQLAFDSGPFQCLWEGYLCAS